MADTPRLPARTWTMPPNPVRALDNSLTDAQSQLGVKAALALDAQRGGVEAGGKIARQQRRIGKTDIFVVGRHAGHRDRPLGEFGDAIAGNVIGRNHGLALSDQYPQSDIIAFGALGFLDPAITHFDALRDAAYCNRVGGVRARAGGYRDLRRALRRPPGPE